MQRALHAQPSQKSARSCPSDLRVRQAEILRTRSNDVRWMSHRSRAVPHRSVRYPSPLRNHRDQSSRTAVHRYRRFLLSWLDPTCLEVKVPAIRRAACSVISDPSCANGIQGRRKSRQRRSKTSSRQITKAQAKYTIAFSKPCSAGQLQVVARQQIPETRYGNIVECVTT